MTPRPALTLATAAVVCGTLLFSGSCTLKPQGGTSRSAPAVSQQSESPQPSLGPSAAVAATTEPVTKLVSIDYRGGGGNDMSGSGYSVSANGRWVAFDSGASDLVRGDTNDESDVFVRDMHTGVTTRVSRGLSGASPNGGSGGPSISADARYVAFSSTASNLVSGDTNKRDDIFVYDRSTGITRRVSLSTIGAQANGHSRYCARISRDGTRVAFSSEATNLVAADTNSWSDIFVRDVRTGTTTRANVNNRRMQANDQTDEFDISGNGRFVVFESMATNLVPGDTNREWDIFVRDVDSNRTTRVSVSSSGMQGNKTSRGPDISVSGRYVVYSSDSSNLVPGDTNRTGDVFVFDRDARTTSRVSVSTSGAQSSRGGSAAAITADGRYVVFWAWVQGFPPVPTGYREPDIYLRDLTGGETTRFTRRARGLDDIWQAPAVSDYAKHVVFSSQHDLMRPDANGLWDVYWCQRAP